MVISSNPNFPRCSPPVFPYGPDFATFPVRSFPQSPEASPRLPIILATFSQNIPRFLHFSLGFSNFSHTFTIFSMVPPWFPMVPRGSTGLCRQVDGVFAGWTASNVVASSEQIADLSWEIWQAHSVAPKAGMGWDGNAIC